MVKVKICGMTNLEDALAAVEYGADMLGFIFAASPRKVEPQTAKEIIGGIPEVVKVGVFMNQDIAEIRDIMVFCGLDMVQLHGNEPAQFCSDLEFPVIKAFTPETLPAFNELVQYPVDSYMLDKQKGSDTRPEELWPIAKEMNRYGRVILAGALTPQNIVEAIGAAQPYAVDVASGVEREPGKKDHRKLKDFIHAVNP